jgi:hypothetical protein
MEAPMKYAAWSAVALILVSTAPSPAQYFPPAPNYPLGRSVRYVAYGYGYVPYGYPLVRVRVLVAAPPIVVVVPAVPAGLPALGDPVPVGKDDEALPFNPNDIMVIRPKPGGVKNLPPLREAPVAAGPMRKMPPADPRAGEPPPIVVPTVDPGRGAFLAGEYGRAAERFEQAIRDEPQKAENLFLLAQAQFALGKYREATATVLAGMKLQPDWPAAKFDLRGLYGNNVADLALHMERLRFAAERNADEPALLFLYGHQLWFMGRRDEAKTYFRKAAPLTTDPRPIERFLSEHDGKVAVK